MIIDSQLSLIPVGAPLTIVATAVASTNTIDLLGQGVGTAPQGIIGNATLFGQDPGIGGVRPELDVAVGTAFSGGTSVNVALQYAADQGVGGSYQPSTWYTAVETGAILTANLTAGAIVARFPWLPTPVGVKRPRFVRLLFTPVGTFSAGTIAFALVTLVRDDWAVAQAAKNFTV